jgi:hypothetical protein
MSSTHLLYRLLAMLWMLLVLASSPAYSRDPQPAAPGSQHASDNSCIFQAQSRTDYASELPERARLEKSIHSAASYLTSTCQDSGTFTYRISLNPKIRFDSGYNLLRHAGAIYALATYARRYPERDLRGPLFHAAKFLQQKIKAPLPSRNDLLALWSDKECPGTDKPEQAKLGGTGLALIALVSVEKIMPGTTPIDDLRRLGRFLRYMQKDDGSFYSRFIPSSGGRDDSRPSLYYPGEAALGLLMLYSIDPAPEWLESATNAISHLAHKRKGKEIVEPDHWALLATAQLLPLYELSRAPLPREDILQHAIKICESILSSAPRYARDEPEYGCLTPDGMTCPTATRLEGLLAALSFLPDGQADQRRRISAACEAGIAFLLRAQVPDGIYAGAVPRVLQSMSEKKTGFDNTINRRAAEVRIDYVQHTLCAMLQFAAISSRGSAGAETAQGFPEKN